MHTAYKKDWVILSALTCRYASFVFIRTAVSVVVCCGMKRWKCREEVNPIIVARKTLWIRILFFCQWQCGYVRGCPCLVQHSFFGTHFVQRKIPLLEHDLMHQIMCVDASAAQNRSRVRNCAGGNCSWALTRVSRAANMRGWVTVPPWRVWR